MRVRKGRWERKREGENSILARLRESLIMRLVMIG